MVLLPVFIVYFYILESIYIRITQTRQICVRSDFQALLVNIRQVILQQNNITGGAVAVEPC